MITDKEIELNGIGDELAQNIVHEDNLHIRSTTEVDVLEVDDQVTLTRRVGRSQVRGKVIDMHVTEKGEVTYDVQPQNGVILFEQSEYSMVKTSIGTRARQHIEDTTNLIMVSLQRDSLVTQVISR